MKYVSTLFFALIACLLLGGSVRAATYLVAPSVPTAGDDNPGTEAKPFKTVAKALAAAKGGDTILLGNGNYDTIRIDAAYDKPLVISAAKDSKPRLLGSLDLAGASGIRVRGLDISWPKGAAVKGMHPFINLAGSRDIEIADCRVGDDPAKAEWQGMAANIDKAKHITLRDCAFSFVYFGVNVNMSEHVTLERLTIKQWTHEDGIRMTECLGPVLIDGCEITNAGVSGRKGGHVDAIQIVFWTDNLTIRNCHIHGAAQAIGAFHCVDDRASVPNRRRKNWRIEGNLIHDIYTPHTMTICETDGVVVINNTLPQGHANLYQCTGGVVKNNIFGSGNLRKDCIVEADYNLWITGGTKIGPSDLMNTDPKFAAPPAAFFKTDHRLLKEVTRSKLFSSAIKGKLAVGDMVEVHNTDGGGSDGKLRKVTAVGDNWIEVDPPLASDPDPLFGVLIYKWPDGHTNLKPDYRLRADSPAIDSADSSVERGKDMDGNKPTDIPAVKNSGVGPVPYLDRGAFEYVPGR